MIGLSTAADGHAPARTRGIVAATDEDLQLINALASEPLTADQVHVFEALVSSNARNTFWCRMAPSSLANYVQDGALGNPLLAGHNYWNLPIGRSFAATHETIDGADCVVLRDYMLAGHEINDIKTDEVARGIRAGTLTDISISYGGESCWYRCSVCNQNLFSPECQHVPGLTYGDIQCIAWVEDAHMGEHSIVYSGSDPNARILRKAQTMAASGRLSAGDISFLEDACGVPLNGHQIRLSKEHDAPDTTGQEERMNARKLLDSLAGALSAERHSALVGRINQLRDATSEDADAAAVVGRLAELFDNELVAAQGTLSAIQEAAGVTTPAEARVLAERAALGDQYRADLIEQALAEGVRAHGNSFNVESYTGVLSAASIETIKLMRGDWKTLADKALGTPGRQTVAGDPAGPTLATKVEGKLTPEQQDAAERFAKGESLIK